jgi:hypothetical protein
VEAAVRLFEAQGFVVTDDPGWESGYDKVAIYGADSPPGARKVYTHAARQLEGGTWSSKLGKLHDIEHKQLSDLESPDYGRVVQVMKRKKA